MTAEQASDELLSVLRTACMMVGVDSADAELLNLSENALFRLPGGVVVRISRPGQQAASRREVDVARWLKVSGVEAVRVIPEVQQPVEVDSRSATFWQELPPHQPGTPAQVAAALRQLHSLDLPATFTLGKVEPFVRLEERIEAASILTDADKQWMRDHLVELRQRWANLPEGLPWCVIHGDAWVGNVVSTEDGRVILLDLERTSIGPPEWDLVHTAIKHSSFGWITKKQYAEFCDVYGYDVTNWDGFELLRDIREFRMTTMAIQVATADPASKDQALRRLSSIQGELGLRPWAGWRALS
ncbi:phosphotransferase [Nocardia thraciensis]